MVVELKNVNKTTTDMNKQLLSNYYSAINIKNTTKRQTLNNINFYLSLLIGNIYSHN